MDDESRFRQAFRRREFIALGAAAAALPLLERAAGAATLDVFSEPSMADVAPLSVGYLLDSDIPGTAAARWSPGGTGAQAPDAEPLQVVPAELIPSSQPDMTGEAVRVRVAGLFPAPSAAASFGMLTLDAMFEAPGASSMLPFHAWTFKAQPAPMQSPPVRFTLPLVDGAVQLVLSASPLLGERRVPRARLGSRPPATTVRAAALSAERRPGTPWLQPGVYLLGIGTTTWDRMTVLPAAGDPAAASLLSVVVSVEAMERGDQG